MELNMTNKITVKYVAQSNDLPLIESCAMKAIIDEQCNAIKQAFSEVEVVFEYDEDWGFVTPISINGMEIKR